MIDLYGKRKNFPIRLYDGEYKREVEIKNEDELIELIDERLKKRTKLSKAVKLEDILWNFCIGEQEEIGTIQLFDKRTEQLNELYWIYFRTPDKFNNKPWYETLGLLNYLQSRRTL